jgi:predicted ATPase
MQQISDWLEKLGMAEYAQRFAETHRIAGEIALKSAGPDSAKAEPYFERALAVAREQQANSWELRAAMSMARLRCDQGKRDEPRALLAPVHRRLRHARSKGGEGVSRRAACLTN